MVTRPSVGRATDHLDEEPVHAHVTGDLRMERRGEQAALPHRDDPSVGAAVGDRGQHLDPGADLLHPRCADEHGSNRVSGDPGEVEVVLEAVHLAAEGVATHRHVDPAESELTGDGVGHPVGQQDHPGAGPVDRHPLRHPLHQQLAQAERAGQLVDRGRLPAGQDEGVHLGELLRPPDRTGDHVALGQRGQVLADVTLDGEDANHKITRHRIGRHRDHPGRAATVDG